VTDGGSKPRHDEEQAHHLAKAEGDAAVRQAQVPDSLPKRVMQQHR
jgi:hypothetical protein